MLNPLVVLMNLRMMLTHTYVAVQTVQKSITPKDIRVIVKKMR